MYAMTFPHIDYGLLIWGSTYLETLQPLVTLQKRFVRIINFAHYQAHADELFRKSGILSIHQLYKLSLASFVYRCTKGLYPTVFDSFSRPLNAVQTRSTRHANNLIVTKVHYESTKRSPRYQGAVLFNQCIQLYDESRNLGYFKRELKKKEMQVRCKLVPSSYLISSKDQTCIIYLRVQLLLPLTCTTPLPIC